MIAASIPTNESERLAELHALELLDTPAEERFDRIVRLAARVFDVPMAYIALVDSDRQWLKAKCGLATDETSRDVSFCAHTILEAETLVIPDAREDARFRDNPLVVGEPGIRFYAGHPLRGPGGHVVGTLCLADRAPRDPDEMPLDACAGFADLVEHELAMVDLIATQREVIGLKSELLAVQERLRHELRDAASFVRSLLPSPVNEARLRASWVLESSSQVGGDVIGYHALDDGAFAFYVVDVMGHGVGAALLASAVFTALRRQTLPDVDFVDPSDVVLGLNRAFPAEDHDNRFFSAWYGVIDPARRRLRYASAGHPPALLHPGDGAAIEQLGSTATIVGVLPDERPDAVERDLPAGSRVLLYSDGVTECRGADGAMLGIDGLVRLVGRLPRTSASWPSPILRGLVEFAGASAFDDDVSILELRVGA